MTKIRLDLYLSENNLSTSREKAKKEIIAGWVKVDGETVRSPSKMITGNEKIIVQRPGGQFVSRGGEKLQHALKVFKIGLSDKVAVDLGASTGGFTDCLLQNGAQKVYSIDVGYGQLDYSLRQNEKVVVKERTNARDLQSGDFLDKIDFITMDLSFISLLKVFDKVEELFAPIHGVVLIKPQFEARRNEHKKGIVRDKKNHKDILFRVLDGLLNYNINILGLCYSPIKGPKGNVEFLLYFELLKRDHGFIKSSIELDELISKVVEEAHGELCVEKG
jgi:23S rRNA (cytidine1920-2'-O)/16S rRNA (cytidine1409-2'-O)-methyltransferase